MLFVLLEIVSDVDRRHLANQFVHQTIAMTFGAKDIGGIDRISMRIKLQYLAIAWGGKREGFPTLAAAKVRADQARAERANEGQLAFALTAAEKIDAAKARLEVAKRDKIPEPSVRIEGDRYNASAMPVNEFMAQLVAN